MGIRCLRNDNFSKFKVNTDMDDFILQNLGLTVLNLAKTTTTGGKLIFCRVHLTYRELFRVNKISTNNIHLSSMFVLPYSVQAMFIIPKFGNFRLIHVTQDVSFLFIYFFDLWHTKSRIDCVL